MNEIHIKALAFERKNVNRRPVFAMSQTLVMGQFGEWQSERHWFGVEPSAICTEIVHWKNGLTKISSSSDSLNESGEAECRTDDSGSPGASLKTSLSNSITKYHKRDKHLVLPYEPVTLSTLPLVIAKYWDRLTRGDTIYASYLVLKVQRAAKVIIRMQKPSSTQQHIVIEVVPSNLILRAIFGKTRLHFARESAPRLLSLHGLMDPRDQKANGRWHEYFGSLEFQQPWDLSAFVQSEQVAS